MLCDGLLSDFKFKWLKITINHLKLLQLLIFG